MKNRTRNRVSVLRGNEQFIPVTEHQNQDTKRKETNTSGAAASSAQTDPAVLLDNDVEKFYNALCKMAEKSEMVPSAVLLATELFSQTLKRIERARLGVPNPEDEE